MTKEEILSYVDKGKKIIIFGAGIVGEVVEYSLRKSGIDVYCFCDNNTEKIGKKLHGIEIKALREVSEQKLDALFVVAVAIHREIEVQIRDYGFEYVTNSRELINDIEIEKYDFSVTHYQVKEYLESYMRHTVPYKVDPEHLVIKNIGLIITERCSLRCKDCVNLMQYFKNPKHIDYDMNIKSMQCLLEKVESIERVSVVGGEPFVNVDMYRIVEWLCQQEKVKNITIFTNATVVPTEERVPFLQHEKVFVSISNYYQDRQKIQALEKCLSEHGINYNIVNERIWKDLGNLLCRNRDEKANNKLFYKCIFDGCFQLMNGQLHYCARSACGLALGAFPEKEGDYFNVLREDLSEEEYMREFLQFISNDKIAPTACDYCSGKGWEAEIIPVGIQSDKVLDFSGEPID